MRCGRESSIVATFTSSSPVCAQFGEERNDWTFTTQLTAGSVAALPRERSRPETLISRALAESASDDEWGSHDRRRNQIGLRVTANLGRLNGVYTKVRSRIESAQRTRVVRWMPRGSSFEVGQHVRLKLQPTERRKLGKKLSPYQSGRYVVIERQGVTYYVRPFDDDSARVMRRHLNRCSRGRTRKTQGRFLTLTVTPLVNDQSVRDTRDENNDPPADCRWIHVTRIMTREHRGRRTIATVVIMIRTK